MHRTFTALPQPTAASTGHDAGMTLSVLERPTLDELNLTDAPILAQPQCTSAAARGSVALRCAALWFAFSTAPESRAWSGPDRPVVACGQVAGGVGRTAWVLSAARGGALGTRS